MKGSIPLFALTVFILVFSTISRAQQMTVELSTPYLASHATAIVVDPTHAPISGVTVNLMSAKWKEKIKSRQTNANGWFSFKRTNDTLLWLEIQYPGFQLMHVKLKIIRGRPKTPAITMELAT